MIHYNCLKCKGDMDVPDSQAGQAEVCPNCKHTSIVPQKHKQLDTIKQKSPTILRDATPTLPKMIWYIGTPVKDMSMSLHAKKADDGRVYTFIWREESHARKFAAKFPCTDYSIHCASVGQAFSCFSASDELQWVVIDPLEDSDEILDTPSCEKINCKRAGDVWPYLTAFLCSQGMEQDIAEAFEEYAKENPELPPWDIPTSYKNALIQEKVIAATDPLTSTTGFPEQPCLTCGERTWIFGKLSPTAASSSWTCEYCGRKLIIKADSNKNQKGDSIRKAIPKKIQREVWRRDQGKCIECGSKENLEFDHIIPVSRGGANTLRNVQLLCESCNRSKSNKEPGA